MPSTRLRGAVARYVSEPQVKLEGSRWTTITLVARARPLVDSAFVAFYADLATRFWDEHETPLTSS
jgi:hypothetical protein